MDGVELASVRQRIRMIGKSMWTAKEVCLAQKHQLFNLSVYCRGGYRWVGGWTLFVWISSTYVMCMRPSLQSKTKPSAKRENSGVWGRSPQWGQGRSPCTLVVVVSAVLCRLFLLKVLCCCFEKMFWYGWMCYVMMRFWECVLDAERHPTVCQSKRQFDWFASEWRFAIRTHLRL